MQQDAIPARPAGEAEAGVPTEAALPLERHRHAVERPPCPHRATTADEADIDRALSELRPPRGVAPRLVAAAGTHEGVDARPAVGGGDGADTILGAPPELAAEPANRVGRRH